MQFEKTNIRRIRPYLSECTVLLRYNHKFPLDGPCRIACFGSGVADTLKGGTGSGEVNSKFSVTVEEALVDSGFIITNRDWYKEYQGFLSDAKKRFKSDVKKTAREKKMSVFVASMGKVMKAPEYDIGLDLDADAAIYVLSRISGEGSDRTDEKGDFRLTDSEVRDILALDKAYDKFMLIINSGGPVDLSPVMEVGNILVLSQLGVETGYAVSDILLGKATPSGKLATTWASYADYSHEGDFANSDDTRYREGIYVGYRYFDAAGKKPLFPFGYGLSYTDFSIEGAGAEADHGRISVHAQITNTGKYNGKEVLECYLAAPNGRLDKEVKSLAAFAKTSELVPGQTEVIRAEFDITDFASFDWENSCYVLEKGEYTVLVGSCSDNLTPVRKFVLKEDKVVKKVQRQYGRPDFEEYRNSREETYDAPSSTLDLGKNKTIECSYDAEEKADSLSDEEAALLESLSDEELAMLNVGAFDPRGRLLSVIGDSAKSVAGAAGESSSILKDKGIRNLVLADGPAGLRLAKEYYVDKKGAHAVGTAIPESMIEFFPGIVRRFLTRKPKIKKGTEIKKQYTTNIPIATAVAQSWNPEFAEILGDIVGSEMETYGVDVWLAPALNIHRNVLCGRNFEYFSEDPVISGKFAAALTKGVQKHDKAVTLKHYAANNQETNRYANNSMVSERALREIYLKGFQLCIKEAHPKTLMTSYNLLNGTHTCESKELVHNILRCEFGFDGLVMTDWVMGKSMLPHGSKYGVPNAALTAAADHSLYMPGSKQDYEEILKGLRDGTVTREQLIRNAMHLWGRVPKAHRESL